VGEPRDPIELDAPPLNLDEAEQIIARLEALIRERRVVLVGGQAVAIWTAQLESRMQGALNTELVASRDIDLLGNASDLRQAGELLDGKVRVAGWDDHTPLTGVAIFLDDKGHERRLDVLESVYGMNSKDVRNTAIEIDLVLPHQRQVRVWVMHPERCMESRVHNSALPTSKPISPGDSCGHRSSVPGLSPSYCSMSAETRRSVMY